MSRARRAFWVAVDQSASSGGNFVLTFLAVRSLQPEQLGAFSIGLTCYLVALSLARAVSTECLLFTWTERDRLDDMRTANAASASVAFAVVAAVATAAIGLVVREALGAFLVLAILLPLVLLQDTWRVLLLVDHRPRAAASNDVLWTGGLLAGMGVLLAADRVTTLALFLVWGISALPAVLLGRRQTGSHLAVAGPGAWWHAHRPLIRRFTAETTISSVLPLLAYNVVAVGGGVTTVGEFRAGLLLFSPLNVAVLAAGTFGLTEGVRLRQRPRREQQRLTMMVIATVTIAFVAWSSVLYAIPDHTGVTVVGQNWYIGRRLLVPVALFSLNIATWTVLAAGIRSVGDAKATLRARVLSVVPLPVASAAGAALGGAHGAAIGLAATATFGTVVWVDAYARALRHRSTDESPPPEVVLERGIVE